MYIVHCTGGPDVFNMTIQQYVQTIQTDTNIPNFKKLEEMVSQKFFLLLKKSFNFLKTVKSSNI